MNIALSCHRVLAIALFAGPSAIPRLLPGQDSTGTRSAAATSVHAPVNLSGTWVARISSRQANARRQEFVLQLTQEMASVSGTAVRTFDGVPQGLTRYLTGTFTEAGLRLRDREDTILILAKVKGDRLEATVAFGTGGPGSGTPQASAHPGALYSFVRKR
jgi:hypothetical protein